LDLSATSENGGVQAQKYDLWVSSRGISIGDAKAISESSIEAAPGIYKLRFYFPGEGVFSIYYGPQIEVKNR
jgi:hypothetical protein